MSSSAASPVKSFTSPRPLVFSSTLPAAHFAPHLLLQARSAEMQVLQRTGFAKDVFCEEVNHVPYHSPSSHLIRACSLGFIACCPLGLGANSTTLLRRVKPRSGAKGATALRLRLEVHLRPRLRSGQGPRLRHGAG